MRKQITLDYQEYQEMVNKNKQLDSSYEAFQANVEMQLADQIQELRNENNRLELTIAELEEEAGRLFSENSDLRDTLETIESIVSRGL